MMNLNDKVICIKYISYDIQMDKIYTVIGIQIGFDNKQFLHLKESNKISYDAENFKKL